MTDTPQHRGMDFLSTRKFVRQTFGEEAVRALGDKLASRGFAGAVTDVILPDDWRPLAEYDAMVATIDEMFAPRAAWRVGRFQCQDQLKWYHRGGMRLLRPAWLIDNTVSVWARYCSVGRWETRWSRANQVVGVLHDMPPVSAAFCATNSGWFERFLELCGCREIKVVHSSCRWRGDAECRHDVSWR